LHFLLNPADVIADELEIARQGVSLDEVPAVGLIPARYRA